MTTGNTRPSTAADTAMAGQRSTNTFAGDTWANFKRWFLKFVRTPHVIVMNLFQPILFLVLFTEVFGDIVSGPITAAVGGSFNYVTFLLPAIAIQVSIMTSEGAGINLVKDIDKWIFDKVMVYPMNKSAVFLGKTASELLRIVIQIGIILALGVILGADIGTGFTGALGVIAVGILFSLIFISITTTVAMLTKDQEAMMSIMMPLMFPLLFLSSAFLPLEKLPGWIQTVARFNPVTYGVDAARAIVLEKDVMTVIDVNCFTGMWNTVIPAVSVLAALALIFGGIAVLTIKRETSSEVR